MRILFLIARQFNQILQVKELASKGMDKGSIAAKMKIQPFVVGKVLPQTRAFSREQILSYEMCIRDRYIMLRMIFQLNCAMLI